jgi:Tfp pilus assembly protein FimT
VTLIELLIVLALLAAIGALALPTTLETLSRRRFESDVDALIGQLRLARTHARTTASAVEVLMERAHDETTRVVVTSKSGGTAGLAVSPHGWPGGASQNFGPSTFAGLPPRLFHTGDASRKLPAQA